MGKELSSITNEEALRIMKEDKAWFFREITYLREIYGKGGKGYVLVRHKRVINHNPKKTKLAEEQEGEAYLGDLSSSQPTNDETYILRGFR